jgi:cytochrome oxidase Cu insertion factor (SCO1/SenC/PrrC family)
MIRLVLKGVKATAGLIFLMIIMIESSHANSKPGGDFSLIDQDRHEFQLDQLRGKVVLLFFGYTSCPDVCPAVLGTLAKVLREFESDESLVKAVFISVDPQRDSPERLKEYTRYFSSQLLGLTGSRDQIDKVAKQYRVKYKISEDANMLVSVDHSSNLYVLDKQGEVNTIIPFGMGAGHIINVVQRLLDN